MVDEKMLNGKSGYYRSCWVDRVRRSPPELNVPTHKRNFGEAKSADALKQCFGGRRWTVSSLARRHSSVRTYSSDSGRRTRLRVETALRLSILLVKKKFRR